MADDASPGFFSSLMGGIGGLLGLKDDPNAQKTGEADADYATRRQNTRFALMKQEVDGLLKKYPATEDLPAKAFSEERRGIRQRGFDQKEEDAIINTFAGAFGGRQGSLAVAEDTGREEWQTQPRTEGPITEDQPRPPLPPGVKMPAGPLLPRDDQVYQRLLDNWNKSGRDEGGYAIGKDKRGRTRLATDPTIGFKT